MTQQGISAFSSNSTRVTSAGWRRRVVARQTAGRRAQRGFGTVSERRADQRRPAVRRAIKANQKRRDIASGRRLPDTSSSRTTSSIQSFHRKSATQGAAAARRAIRRRRSKSTGRFQ